MKSVSILKPETYPKVSAAKIKVKNAELTIFIKILIKREMIKKRVE